MIKNVKALAAEVERSWRKKNYSRGSFPEIAAQSLARHRLHEQFRLSDVLAWIKTAYRFPHQHDLSDPSGFGHPPMTLYVDGNFFIDLYFWVVPAIAIHDHKFSGAFSLISGRSLHCLFDFSVSEKPDEQLLMGDLKLKEAELLEPGAVRTIVAGPSFIHQVWHLSRPTVSIAIRTRTDRRVAYQYNYDYPGIARSMGVQRGLADEIYLKRWQTMQFLYGINHPGRDKFSKEIILNAKPTEAVGYLNRFFSLTGDLERTDFLLRRLQKKYGAWVRPLHDYFRRQQRVRSVRWERISDEGERLKQIFNLMERHEPRCHAVIKGLLEGISSRGKMGL